MDYVRIYTNGRDARSGTSRNTGKGKVEITGIIVVVIVVLLVLLVIFRRDRTSNYPAEGPYAEWIGKPAPGLALNDLEGNTITLSGLKGRRVVLDFFATWCPPCLAEIPYFVQMQADNSKDKLMIIGISDEGENILAAFGKKYKINYPMVSASSGLPRPYSDVRDIPTTFFIDRKGIIQSVLIAGHSAATLREHALGADYQAPVEAEPAVRPPGGF